jgi:hypothetical protein
MNEVLAELLATALGLQFAKEVGPNCHSDFPPVADIDIPAAFLRAAAPARRRDRGRLDSQHLNPDSQAIDPGTVAVTHLLPPALRSRDTVIIKLFAGSVSGPACSDTVSIYRVLLDCPLLSRRSHLYPRGHDIDAAFWHLPSPERLSPRRPPHRRWRTPAESPTSSSSPSSWRAPASWSLTSPRTSSPSTPSPTRGTPARP